VVELVPRQVVLVRLHIHKDRVVAAAAVAARNSRTVKEQERTDGCDTAMVLLPVDTEDRPVVVLDKDDDNMLVELRELLLELAEQQQRELALLVVEQQREQELLLAGSDG